MITIWSKSYADYAYSLYSTLSRVAIITRYLAVRWRPGIQLRWSGVVFWEVASQDEPGCAAGDKYCFALASTLALPLETTRYPRCVKKFSDQRSVPHTEICDLSRLRIQRSKYWRNPGIQLRWSGVVSWETSSQDVAGLRRWSL